MEQTREPTFPAGPMYFNQVEPCISASINQHGKYSGCIRIGCSGSMAPGMSRAKRSRRGAVNVNSDAYGAICCIAWCFATAKGRAVRRISMSRSSETMATGHKSETTSNFGRVSLSCARYEPCKRPGRCDFVISQQHQCKRRNRIIE